MALVLENGVWKLQAAPPSGPSTTIYSADGTSVTLGTVDGDGYRTVAGGGLPLGTKIFDPDSQCSIVSNNGAGRFELTIASNVTTANYSPFNSNWYTGGPALIFPGSVKDDTFIEVEDLQPSTPDTNDRISVCALNIDAGAGQRRIAQGCELYQSATPANSRSHVRDFYRVSTQLTVQTLTLVTFPTRLKIRCEADESVTPINPEIVTNINGGPDIGHDWNIAGGANYAIGFAGFAATYYFGNIALRV
jgi:hypothetical protein